MKFYQIIKNNEAEGRSLLVEKLLPYKKSLEIYYRNQFGCEPLLMVTAVFNAAQYGKIVPANEFSEAVEEWVGNEENITNLERDAEIETIMFNSMALSKL